MTGKVLMNVFSRQVKNDLLQVLVDHHYDFVEVMAREEFDFKWRLCQDHLLLYLHELSEEHYEASMNQLRRVSGEKVRSILLIHEYASRLIDEALNIGVNDIVVLPMDKENLRKKLLASLRVPTYAPYVPSIPSERDMPKSQPWVFDETVVMDEINRSMRGQYPLSIVLVEYHQLNKQAFSIFENHLIKFLRTTDRIIRYENSQLLILCPFTSKAHLVEVENKVRRAHGYLKDKIKGIPKCHLYGVTYPVDGETKEALLGLLEDGLHDSLMVDRFEGTLDMLQNQTLRSPFKRNFNQPNSR